MDDPAARGPTTGKKPLDPALDYDRAADVVFARPDLLNAGQHHFIKIGKAFRYKNGRIKGRIDAIPIGWDGTFTVFFDKPDRKAKGEEAPE